MWAYFEVWSVNVNMNYYHHCVPWIKLCLFFLIHSLGACVNTEWVWDMHILDKSQCISFIPHMKRTNVKTFLVRLIYYYVYWHKKGVFNALMIKRYKQSHWVTLPSIYWSWKFKRILFIKESPIPLVVRFSLFSWQIADCP